MWTDESKAAYAAGIMDGEGCITIPRTPRNQTFHLYVQINQAIKGWSILEFLKEHFGGIVTGKYQPLDRRKALRKNVIWSGLKACRFLKKIRPYLILKSQQADLAIRFQDMLNGLPPRGKFRSWNAAALLRAAEYAAEIKSLNQRGCVLNAQLSVPIKDEEIDLFNQGDCHGEEGK